jgi:hypothetical protein
LFSGMDAVYLLFFAFVSVFLGLVGGSALLE